MEKRIASLFIVSVSLYLLWFIKPVVLHQIEGTFETVEVPKDYLVSAEILKRDKNFSRTFWLPRRQNFGFSSYLHPPVWAEDFISEVRERRPFSSLLIDKYNFLSYFQNPATREIFKILGLKYAVVPYDSQGEIFLTDRKYDERLYQRIIDELDKVAWLKRLDPTSKVGLYQADFETRHFFPVKSTFFVVGADDFYATISALPDFRLSDFGFYFFEESLGEKPELKEGDILVLNQKTVDDLALSFLEENYSYPFFPLLTEKDFPGWQAVDLVNSARTVGFENIGFDFGKNMVLSHDLGNFEFPFSVNEDGKYEIFLRFFKNHLGGELQFNLDNAKSVKIQTRGEEDEFVWEKVVSDVVLSEGRHTLLVKNRQGLNALNLLAVLPKEKFLGYEKRAEEYLENPSILHISKTGEEFTILREILKKETPEISSKMLSLTKYLVSVKNAKEPFWLVFSETYYPLWQAKIGKDKITPVKLYSLINGFYINKTGDFEVEVEFTPQRYVNWGMVLSGLTGSVIILLFIKELMSWRVRDQSTG